MRLDAQTRVDDTRTGRVLMVVPTYNEAPNITALIERLLDVGPWLDVLVVDDDSPDGTSRIVGDAVGQSKGRLQLLTRTAKNGRGGAVLTGFRTGLDRGQYAIFGEMDADLSHLPEQLPSLLQAAEGADVVVGTRYIPGGSISGWPRRRRSWSWTTNRIIGLVLRVGIHDYTNGYRLYRRSAVEALVATRMTETGFIALSEWIFVLHRRGARIVEVPTAFVNRTQGKSNMGPREAIDALRGIVRVRLRRDREGS